MSARRTFRWLILPLAGIGTTGVVVGTVLLFNYVQRERAFADVRVDGIHRARGEWAGEYLATCSFSSDEIDRLIDLFPKCSQVAASNRIGQLLERSAPASWNTSGKAATVADQLVTAIDHLVKAIAEASNTQLDEEAFAKRHHGIRPNERDRAAARGSAIFALEQNGISPGRVAALVTGLGYVGVPSREAQRCLTERLSDKNSEVREAAKIALQRLGKPVEENAP